MTGQLDRRQASAILGVSPRTLRRLESQGAIARTKRAHGCDWFAAADVYALRAEREAGRPVTDGEVAARVFRCIARGMRPNDIVLAARQPPDVVGDLFRAYHEADGAMVLSSSQVAELQIIIGAERDRRLRTFDELATRLRRQLAGTATRAAEPSSDHPDR